MQKVINFNLLNITINYKKIKYLRLKVDTNGNIAVSAPLKTDISSIKSFVSKNEAWIKSCQKKYTTTPDKVKFLGKNYTLKFNAKLKNTILELENKTIITPSQAEFDKFLFAKAKEIFDKYISIYSPIIKKDINHISIKKMHSRWGSCNSKKGYLNLNLNLIKKDELFIEYVVLHELTHLIYPHHQKSFYSFIENIMPDFRDRERL